MTDTHSRIVNEHIDSELFTHIHPPNDVYDGCQQSYRSNIVASHSFDPRDGTDEMVRIVSGLLIRYLAPHLMHLSTYIEHLRAPHKFSSI